MIRHIPLKALFYLNLLIVILLVGYKLYLNLYEPDPEGVHASQIAQITDRIDGRESFSFAVVGNINNSVGIFERKIIPMLNASGVDFVISAGNAVSGGGEDKYRALRGTLSHLQIPYLLTFGQQEYENFGSFRYYEHFGPYFYSFHAGNSLFVFLDSTDKTPWRWQIRWLTELLERDDVARIFMFTGHPLYAGDAPMPFVEEEDFLGPDAFRDHLLDLIHEHDVEAVFSANVPRFARMTEEGTAFVTTGGAGGLVLNDETSFYHFVKVSVSPDGVDLEMVPLEVGQHPVWKRLESLWFFIYSLFYVGYVNFILLISALSIVAIKLYSLVFQSRDYYPDYDLDPSPWTDQSLGIAMFTNNYLPFIGGVPISIDRLRQGLRAAGNRVLIVAPGYREQADRDEEDVERVPTLLAMGEKREFRIANPFVPRIRKQVRAFRPDVIHVHHPFWLGTLGLYMARRLSVPTVYTYHTRLEHYAHFVPLPGALFRNLLSHALVKRFANKCDGVIVPTYSAEDYLRTIGVRSMIFVQPTGIDYQRFQQVGEDDVLALRQALGIGDELVFVTVSRLSREKNIDFMIDALAELRSRTNRAFRLLIVGDGQDQGRLKARVDALGLDAVVRFTGSVPPDRMATYYRLGDVFLFASKSETQGMVILEAMAAGLPVVAVRSSGIDDVVRDGYNGYKTPENRDRWCDRVLSLMDDAPLRRELSAHAQAFAREFSIDNYARDVKEIYATVLASRSKG